MMVYQEKIPRPLALPLTDEEQTKLKLKATADEDHWVKNFIDRLAGAVRDLKK